MASFKFAFLLFALWALAILGTASAINSCSLDQGAYQLASHCPQDGNEYLVQKPGTHNKSYHQQSDLSQTPCL